VEADDPELLNVKTREVLQAIRPENLDHAPEHSAIH
jgi:hypothetical protein